MKKNKVNNWKKKLYSQQQERLSNFTTISNLQINELYTNADLNESELESQLSFPGEFPFTRGVQPSMYRGRLWTMRQFAGFGSPEDTNNRFKYLLAQGQTGLSTAFDMPTLMGYDPEDELSQGEVGKEGVSISNIEDMELLFEDIDLTKVTTSMTINCTASIILAMYFAIAKRRKNDLNQLGGTIQNDILKEYIAQKEWISPPPAGLKLSCDLIEYCSKEAKKFNPISISGYHIREAGSTAAQELAFTIYNGVTYVEDCQRRGINVDSFAPRLSFFFDVHNDFFEEIAKFRAARRIWANLMKDRFKAKELNSMKLRTHAQTAGVSLTAQQPLNNVTRVALQALAAVFGGTQSLHTNSMDETYALPTEEAATVALRTQQIIAEETGVTNTIDPLGGSYFVESLTNKIETLALEYIDKLDSLGGMLRAIEIGYPQKEIAEAAYTYQKQLESKEKIIIGVNKYQNDVDSNIEMLKVEHDVEKKQIVRSRSFKSKRNKAKLSKVLNTLINVCKNNQNVMPALIDAVEQGATVGEVSNIYRDIFGVYRDPGLI